nr:MAG TPA: hypothetical protein [Caudoviricetes sp.]
MCYNDIIEKNIKYHFRDVFMRTSFHIFIARREQ